jgi:hypothetical protein
MQHIPAEIFSKNNSAVEDILAAFSLKTPSVCYFSSLSGVLNPRCPILHVRPPEIRRSWPVPAEKTVSSAERKIYMIKLQHPHKKLSFQAPPQESCLLHADVKIARAILEMGHLVWPLERAFGQALDAVQLPEAPAFVMANTSNYKLSAATGNLKYDGECACSRCRFSQRETLGAEDFFQKLIIGTRTMLHFNQSNICATISNYNYC